MILQNSFKKVIIEEGKKIGLTEQESINHYLTYIDEFVLNSLYEADFDILRLNGLGNITASMLSSKKFSNSIVPDTEIKSEIKRKTYNLYELAENLNKNLKRKKLYG